VKKTLLIAAALMTWALSPSAAQDISSILQSLPEEVQKNIEQVRTSCREHFTGFEADPSLSPDSSRKLPLGTVMGTSQDAKSSRRTVKGENAVAFGLSPQGRKALSARHPVLRTGMLIAGE
jgi:hypothetical protein